MDPFHDDVILVMRTFTIHCFQRLGKVTSSDWLVMTNDFLVVTNTRSATRNRFFCNSDVFSTGQR